VRGKGGKAGGGEGEEGRGGGEGRGGEGRGGEGARTIILFQQATARDDKLRSCAVSTWDGP
jgi:hypothetical protein